MYAADNGTLQVKPAYIFWCVTDFSIRPHGQTLGIALRQLLIGVQHHALVTLMIATWHFNSCALVLSQSMDAGGAGDRVEAMVMDSRYVVGQLCSPGRVTLT